MNLELFTLFARDCSASFFGLKSWWYYLPESDFKGCSIKQLRIPVGNKTGNDIPLILLAVVDDLLRIAGMVAVAFVLYGAIKLIASQGDPDGAANARGTILNALIGVAIAMVAITMVAFIGNRVGK